MKTFALLMALASAAAKPDFSGLNTDLSLVNQKLTHLTSGSLPGADNAPPTAEVHFNSTGSWSLFKQCDPAWGSQELGTCAGETICSAGCAMSSVAMMLATKGIGTNPGVLDAWLTQNGGYASGCLIVWAAVDAFGVTSFQGMEQADESAICSGLDQMHGIIANVNNGGHWVLLTGCAGGGVFYVNDPGYDRSTYSMSEILQEAVYH